MQEILVWFLGQEDPLEKDRLPTPVFLPGESHGQRSLAGYSPRGHKESDTAEQLGTYWGPESYLALVIEFHAFNKTTFYLC